MLRRPLLVLVVGAGFVAASLLTAAPASAATYSTTISVNGACVATVTSGSAIPVTLQPGDQITIASGASGTCSLEISGPANLTGWVINSVNFSGVSSHYEALTMGPTWVVTAGSASADIYTKSGAGRVTTLASLTAGGGGSSSSSSAAGSGPAAVVQQFARPTSGTCDAAQPVGLNWSGVASGGWSESWAEWANSGTGGAVCTRTLSYSSGAWRIG